MRSQFDSLADSLCSSLPGDEVLLLSFDGEQSDFVRFNHGKVRQAGSVEQRVLELRLVQGQRHSGATVVLSGDHDADVARGQQTLQALREQLPLLPEDPHLMYSEEPVSSELIGADSLPVAADAIDSIVTEADGTDMVGIWASGDIHHGFANSLGQRNWFST
ncbi:MAG: TldE/PmbA family protein, partial [Deltaproteobacteria bacterium]|nr:TldE/PmbA family protein [Deltaproteobacteria bacterium]